ncbi:MAG TPA: DUF362 domain-containing protein [Firmicutes bacterium]|nr:DUF362 domain-containing protein [Bacillota bacterium]
MRALIQILKGLGCNVWIGDSSGGAIGGIAPTTKSFSVSGLERVAEEEGAIIKNFDKEGVVEIKPASGCVEKMYLAKPMFAADFVINLPKQKTHSAGIFTGAVKNLFGCIPGLKKAEYHRLAPNQHELGEVICDIHQAARVGLHIMDGIIAMQGEGPTAGEVYRGEKILISTDPLALDTVAAAMLGLEVEDIPILATARKRQLGVAEWERIEIAGDYNTTPRYPGFKLPRRYKRVVQTNAALLRKVIAFFKTRPRINKKNCKGCNMCVESCPVQAIDRETKLINYDTCIECMCCHELCQHKAVELRKDNRLAALLARIFRVH